MPLAKPPLRDALFAWFDSLATVSATPTAQAGADAIVDAYAAYAAAALSCGGGSPMPGTLAAAAALAKATLGAVFASSVSLPTTAAGIAAAFTAFWMVPPVAFSAVPPALPGAVLAAPGGGALTAAIAALGPTGDAGAAADAFADALDAFTKTVTVLHPLLPVGTCALPIS